LPIEGVLTPSKIFPRKVTLQTARTRHVSGVIGDVCNMRIGTVALSALMCGAMVSSALAASTKPVVTAVTVTADKNKIKTDTTTLTKDTAALTTAKNQYAANAKTLAADQVLMAQNLQKVSALQAQLVAALAKHDFATATTLQTQIAAQRTANAKLETTMRQLNATLKTQQATINAANEKVILDTRQLKLDTDKLNADQYYLAIGKL
jgi:hypothetical protein